MKFQIHHGRGDIFDGRKPLVEILRTQQAFQQILRHRFTRCHMAGVLRQHFGHLQPMFVKLAGQFHEIAGHRRAGNKAMRHIRQHLMQRMAKFMKQRARVVIGQKRRVALGEVADIDNDWPHIAAQFALAAHG